MVRAVIFDMDGVLIDTEKYLVKYWVQAGQEFGFDMKREHGLMIRSLAAKYAGPLLQSIFGENFDYPAVRRRRKELMAQQLKKTGIEKKPFVDEALEALKAMGIKTAVATATDMQRAGSYLKQIGIYDKFDRVICADMVENGKPQPDIYEYACRQIKEAPENCVAVEDSPNGVLSAARAGLQTVMVPDLTEPDDQTRRLLCACIPDLSALPGLIRKMNVPMCACQEK